MVVAIILTIVAIALPNILKSINNARVARAVGDIHTIGGDLLGLPGGKRRLPLTNQLVDVGRRCCGPLGLSL